RGAPASFETELAEVVLAHAEVMSDLVHHGHGDLFDEVGLVLTDLLDVALEERDPRRELPGVRIALRRALEDGEDLRIEAHLRQPVARRQVLDEHGDVLEVTEE